MNPAVKQAEAVLTFAKAENLLHRSKAIVFAPWAGVIDFRFAQRLLGDVPRAALLVSRIRAADAIDGGRS